ncbi:MAG: DNA replication/repair protein RecF [Bacteroidales bacterium]|nr:DNA replication/repair protein RecF [Bacteroidales bacterium]
MYVKEIRLINFRNYEDAVFTFSPGLNAVSGKNGVGKTNLLDAVHYLSMCKSYFTATDQQAIRHDSPFFALHGTMEEDGAETKLSCIQQRNARKVFKINGKEYERLADHIGLFPSVMISPYDQDYIQGGSESRRRYFDSVISQYDHSYLEWLMQYNKLLQQRNALLKQSYELRRLQPADFEVWDERMVLFAERIFAARSAFLKDFLPVFRDYFHQIADEGEEAEIRFESDMSSRPLAESLRESMQRDYYSGHTSCGPHKDDYLFLDNGYPVKRYCSQGQQKTFLIALKLAQFAYVRQIKRLKPLLLLDDVFDKLDLRRVQCLTSLVAEEQFCQVFLTDTHAERLEEVCSSTGIPCREIRLG